MSDSRPDTYQHIQQVQRHLNMGVRDLLHRSEQHDQSKLTSPEVEMFDEFAPKLKVLELNSPEYNAAREAMGAALQHHYEHNSHHPEHYPNGVQGMTLLDVFEMLCDWQASAQRKGVSVDLESQQQRFGYSDELKRLMLNTLGLLEKD